MAGFPKSVKIGAHTYEMALRSAKEMDQPTDSSSVRNAKIGRHWTHYGSMWPGDLRIDINSKVKPTMRAEVVAHEILHAIVELSGLRGLFKRGREEEIVQAIGHMFTQVLLENPKVRKLFGD